MSVFGKITRILWKTVLFSFLFIVGFILFLFILLQTEKFQTWAAQKLTTYLSEELQATVSIEKVSVSFIRNVTLHGVLLKDKHQDTLIYGKIFRWMLVDLTLIKRN